MSTAIRGELESIPFFADVLGADQLDQLSRDCEQRTFPRGSALMREGELATSMFCLIEGEVLVTVDRGRGPQELIRLRGGSPVGEMEVLAGSARLATVVAVTEVRALEISRATIERFVQLSPDLAETFAATLGRRLDIWSARSLSRSGLRQWQVVTLAILVGLAVVAVALFKRVL